MKGSSHTVLWPDYDDYRLGVLIGMLYGNGNLMRRSTALRTGKWRVEFCEGDAGIVRKYAELMQEVFNVRPAIRDRLTWQEAYYCSRICYEFLTHVGEHPDGKKTGNLCFPEIVKRYHNTLLGFIAGLYSVEGSVKAGRYTRLALEMLEPRLIPELWCQLRTMGFNVHTYRYAKNHKTMYGVYIYGAKDCYKFLNEVGLLGSKRRKLIRFLRSLPMATPARNQPGGEEIRRM